MTLLLAALGAGAGACARWALDRAVQARHDGVFPWSTFVINVSGSLALGFLLGAAGAGRVGEEALALAGAGFCGGFTTFSTFGYETVRLAQEGSGRHALLNAGTGIAAGLAASAAGWSLAAAVWG